MFDIGFWELVLVGVVSLLVFGPERLPRVAREAALWLRKVRAMVASVKSEIDQELQLQELRQSLLKEKKKLEAKTRMAGRKELAKPATPDPERASPGTGAEKEGHEHD